MSYVIGLRCRECGTAYPREAHPYSTEGIFTEPAGGTTVAVTKKLIEEGRIPRHESIVICVTGNGDKTLEAVTPSAAQPSVINARLRDFDGLRQQWAAPRARVVGH